MTNPTLRFHHTGYAVREIAASAAMFTGTFGYTIASAVIHDPLQTALVQFLAMPSAPEYALNHPPYLELVAPDGPASKLTRTVEKRPGLNHLCYTAPALAATIDHLTSQGLTLFSEPKPAVAFAGRQICWLMAPDGLLVELVERRNDEDLCLPGL